MSTLVQILGQWVFSPFRRRTIREMIDRELEDALMRKLEAESAVEYSQAMVGYYSAKIARLRRRMHGGDT